MTFLPPRVRHAYLEVYVIVQSQSIPLDPNHLITTQVQAAKMNFFLISLAIQEISCQNSQNIVILAQAGLHGNSTATTTPVSKVRC